MEAGRLEDAKEAVLQLRMSGAQTEREGNRTRTQMKKLRLIVMGQKHLLLAEESRIDRNAISLSSY